MKERTTEKTVRTLVALMNAECPSPCGRPYMVDIAYCYGGIAVTLGSRHILGRAPRGEIAQLIRAWIDSAEMERARQLLIQDTIREAQYLAKLQGEATRKAVHRRAVENASTRAVRQTFYPSPSGDCDPVTGAEYGVAQ